MAEQEYINIGATANDGTGDPLRVAFEKINNNFTSLFQTGTGTYLGYSSGNIAGQVIFETPVDTFTQASFQIRATNSDTPDSQDTTIAAQITNDNLNVKYTVYGTIFAGNALSRYSMDVSSGNVRLMADPIVNQPLTHFIAAQITFVGYIDNGLNIALNGYTDSVVSTEDLLNITTEN